MPFPPQVGDEFTCCCPRIFRNSPCVFWAESAIWPDSLQRAGALGLLCRLLPMGVVDAESLEGGAEGEHNKLGNGRRVTLNKDIADWDGCETL